MLLLHNLILIGKHDTLSTNNSHDKNIIDMETQEVKITKEVLVNNKKEM